MEAVWDMPQPEAEVEAVARHGGLSAVWAQEPLRSIHLPVSSLHPSLASWKQREL